MDDELVPIVSTKGALADREEVSLDELKNIPVVLREHGSGTLDVIQQALHRCNINLSDLNVEMNFGTTEGIKHYVEHTDCMGIISVRSVNKELYANVFRVVDIRGLRIDRKLAFVEKRGEITGLHKALKDFITQSYRA